MAHEIEETTTDELGTAWYDRRGYENASVSDSGSRVSVKMQLPASEALRAVGSVRY